MTLFTTPFHARSTAAEVLDGVDLTGRRMIVTGGASGIGAAAVQALRAAGAEVTVATRHPAGDEKRLDLADLASVRKFVADWSGPLHAVVANAGIMAVPTRQTTANGWELHLATNFLGHFALITGLRESLRATPDARVVTVSSGAQQGSPVHFDDPHFERRPYDRWAAYAQSKTADVLLAIGVSRKYGITANSLEPGMVHTGLQKHLAVDDMRAFDAMDADGNLLHPDTFRTADQGASTLVLLAASPLLDGVTGRFFGEDNQEAPVARDGQRGVAPWSIDPAAADRLWDLAERAVSR